MATNLKSSLSSDLFVYLFIFILLLVTWLPKPILKLLASAGCCPSRSQGSRLKLLRCPIGGVPSATLTCILVLIIILEPRQFTSDAATNSAPVLSRGAGSGRAVMTARLSGARGWRIPRGHDLMPMSSPAVSLSLSLAPLLARPRSSAASLHPAIRIQRSGGGGGAERATWPA